MNRVVPFMIVAILALGCSTKPVTGDHVKQETTPEGIAVTEQSSRSVLPSGGLAGEESALRKITANVEDVDVKKRLLTLRMPDDRVVPLQIGQDVQNLAQVDKGDTVELEYFQSIEFEVRQPTEEEIEMSGLGVGLAGRAPLGAKPGAIVAGQQIGVVTIEAIDKKRQEVTVRGEGGTMTVKAKYPQNLSFLKVGDAVVVKTTELMAVSIKEIG
jgi:hypothetical protein